MDEIISRLETLQQLIESQVLPENKYGSPWNHTFF